MFFVLSKLLGFLAVPSNLIALLGLAGLALLATRRRRIALALMGASIAALAIVGFSPLGHALLLPLTERFPAWQANGRDPDGIIILGGTIDPEASQARNTLEMDASAERIMAMLQLARRYPRAKVVFSGGSGNLVQTAVPEAPLAGALLAEFGVSRDRIMLEGNSRTTAENADGVRAMLAPRPGERWLLVTSAWHMPRSIGVFRRAGFDVEAYPVDWRSRGWINLTLPFDQLSGGLARTDVAVHEWVGLVTYWLLGRTSELFPSPRSAPCDDSRPQEGEGGCRR